MTGSSEKAVRIGIVAPGRCIDCGLADRAREAAFSRFEDRVELVFHPQCFLTDGHFAGEDDARLAALVEVANDPHIDAVWLARGGYGSCRIAETAIGRMEASARSKAWLGYSDMGFLLGGLYKAGFQKVAHGPMPVDLNREGGEAAFRRGLGWLYDGAVGGLEKGVTPGSANMAFNLTILSQMLGTPLAPDFTGHMLLIEDVGEYMYRIDRAFFHLTSNPAVRGCAGLRLGRISDIPDNDPDFLRTAEEVARYWCERSGIPYFGRADIGHDIDNKIVPFGRLD